MSKGTEAEASGTGGAGASLDTWERLERIGLSSILLPVVSEPGAKISENSSLKTLGKTPSQFNKKGEAVGIKAWPLHVTTDQDIKRWSKDRRLGICIRTGAQEPGSLQVVAIDIDIGDATISRAIVKLCEQFLGLLPTRSRSNSGKCLLCFVMRGEFVKRILHTAYGAIEFLATGQQFVAIGTHTSGVRYKWSGWPANELPRVTPERFEDLWYALSELYSTEPERVARGGLTRSVVGRNSASGNDDVVGFLESRGWVRSRTHDGRVNITCPWAGEHTTDDNETATQYFPAGVGSHAAGKFERGHFHCLHAHCVGRTDGDYLDAVKYMDGEFEVLPDQTPEQQDHSSRVRARNQAKRRQAEAKSSAPSTAEISRKIDTDVASRFDSGEIAKMAIESLAQAQLPAAQESLVLKKLKSVTGIGIGALRQDLSVATRAASNASDVGVSINNPVATAQSLLEQEFMGTGHVALRRWQNVFYVWNGKHYVEFIDEDIRSKIYKLFATHNVVLPTKAPVDHTFDALRAHTNVGSGVTMPGWLCKDPPAPATEVIPVSNGLLHRPSRALLAPDARFFTCGSVDVEFDQNAPVPSLWLKFMGEVFHGDHESIDALQQWFGYLLTSDTSHQKALICVGPKRSGKGTIGRVLKALLGDANYCGPSLNQLGKDFGLQSLIGKNLALISDARVSGRADQQMIAEVILNITGEDAINVQRKNLIDWVGKLTARFVLLTNVLPGIIDAGGAVASRFIVLKFDQSFYGREDPKLIGKLMQELPGILNWALDGLEALQRSGYLSQPSGGLEAMAELKRRTTPLVGFIEDVLILDTADGAWVPKDALYEAYRQWCDREGQKFIAQKSNFLSELYAASDQQLSACRPHDKSGGRVHGVKGARLRPWTKISASADDGANAPDIET